MIRFVATASHYRAHVQPIADELTRRGIETERCDGTTPIVDDGAPTVIAGMSDQAIVPHSSPLCLVSHGIDQTYIGCEHSSYAGGRDRDRVSLFLCSTPHGLAANEAVYPNARHELIGPVTLDKWHNGFTVPRSLRVGAPVVAFAWHFPLTIVPETMWAWPHYQPVIERLAADSPYTLLGHAHPRARESIEGHYDRLGIEIVRDPDEVMARADLVCFDNTSFGYECAAVGIPVLALDAPHYRAEPEQLPRFYRDVPGLRLRAYREQAPTAGMVHGAWGRDNLGVAIEEALDDRASLKDWRARVVQRVYGETLDGRAAVRGADALQEWAGQG